MIILNIWKLDFHSSSVHIMFGFFYCFFSCKNYFETNHQWYGCLLTYLTSVFFLKMLILNAFKRCNVRCFSLAVITFARERVAFEVSRPSLISKVTDYDKVENRSLLIHKTHDFLKNNPIVITPKNGLKHVLINDQFQGKGTDGARYEYLYSF